MGRGCSVSNGLAADKAAPLENHGPETSGGKPWNAEHKMKYEPWVIMVSLTKHRGPVSESALTWEEEANRWPGRKGNLSKQIDHQSHTIFCVEVCDEAILWNSQPKYGYSYPDVFWNGPRTTWDGLPWWEIAALSQMVTYIRVSNVGSLPHILLKVLRTNCLATYLYFFHF